MTTPAEEEAIIRYRFLTQTAVSRGDPPLKKLVKKYVAFCDDLENGSVEKVEKEYKHLMRELSTVEFSLEKMKFQREALERERQSFVSSQSEMDMEVQTALAGIENKKHELEQAKLDRQHQEEYEALKRLIVQHRSRSLTHHESELVNSQISAIEQKEIRAQRSLERKQKQFALLLHTVAELQKTLDEEDQSLESATASLNTLPTRDATSAPMQLG